MMSEQFEDSPDLFGKVAMLMAEYLSLTAERALALKLFALDISEEEFAHCIIFAKAASIKFDSVAGDHHILHVRNALRDLERGTFNERDFRKLTAKEITKIGADVTAGMRQANEYRANVVDRGANGIELD